MKQQVIIPPFLAESIALGYNNLQSARELFRAVATDPNSPQRIIPDFIALSAGITPLLERIDRRIPMERKQVFEEQIKDTDPLMLDNIKALFTRMDKEQKETLEMVAEAILKR
jgi:hypothetical protein